MEMSVIVNKHFVDIVLFRKADESSGYDKKERNYEEEARLRAFRQCVEYGLNNNWQYFLTITLDDKKVDSSNYNYVVKKVLKEMENIRRYYDNDLKYLFVPEIGSKNNRLHFHGLVKFGKSLDQLKADGEIKYLGCNKKFKNRYYRFERFFEKYGSSRLDEIVRDSPAIVYYIVAYLGKSNRKIEDRKIERIGKRYYYCSKGLHKAAREKPNKQQESNIIAGVRNLPAIFENEFLQKFRLTKQQYEQLAEGRYLVKYDAETGEVLEFDAVKILPTVEVVKTDAEPQALPY